MAETAGNANQVVVERSLACAVRGETATVSQSAVGAVATTGSIDVRQSLVGPVFSGSGVTLSQGGSTALVAFGDGTVRQGYAQWVFTTGDVTMEWAGAAVVAAPTVKVERGWVGLVLSRHTELAEGARVLLRPSGAAALGGAAGLALGALLLVGGSRGLSRLLSRKG
jgi:hypothetical protein